MIAAASKSALTEIVVNTAATTLVGLLVGAVAFPVRWMVEASKARRQADLALLRDSRRALRTATIEQTRPDAPGRHDAELWHIAMTQALSDVDHRLAEARDTKTYDLIHRLLELHQRGSVVPHIWPPEAEDDPRAEIVNLVDIALAHRIRHRWRRQSISARVDLLASLVEESEDMADAQWRQQREEFIVWRAEHLEGDHPDPA